MLLGVLRENENQEHHLQCCGPIPGIVCPVIYSALRFHSVNSIVSAARDATEDEDTPDTAGVKQGGASQAKHETS